MKCAIHQPQFVPWLGYLNKINSADVFVFLDNVQYHKNEWQNRNRICTPKGAHWFTVPVSYKFGDHINRVVPASHVPWQDKLWRTLEHQYAKAPYFGAYREDINALLHAEWSNLAELNIATVEWLMKCFAIATPTHVCSTLPAFIDHRTQRLVEICQHVGADVYLSGAQAKDYLDVARFEAAGLSVEFQDYTHPTYDQVHDANGFVSHLSALDALFQCGGGEEARDRLNL